MQRRTPGAIALVVTLLLAGCTGFGGGGTPVPETSPTATPESADTPEPTPTPTPTATDGEACEQPTPRPVPDMRLINRVDDPRSLIVTVAPRDGGPAVYNETVTLGPDEDGDRYEVVPEAEEYRIKASLPDNTSASTVMEMDPGDRYSITTVIVQENRILIERLGIHPEPTPTPCPS